MSTKRLTIILVQVTIVVCLVMTMFTFIVYSGSAEQVSVATVALLSGGGGALRADGGFMPAGLSHPIQRPRINNHNNNNNNDGDGLLEMVDGTPGAGSNIVLERYNEHEVKQRQLREKIERLTAHSSVGHQADEAELRAAGFGPDGAQQRPYENVSTQHVHIFYRAPVPWYLPEAEEAVGLETDTTNQQQRFIRDPADALADSGNRITEQPLQSAFYPMLGIYSITAKVLDVHFRNIMQAGVGVMVVGWQPQTPGSLDIVKRIMNYARKTCGGRLTVALELLPYPDRSVSTMRADLQRLHEELVWAHPAMYRVQVQMKGGRRLPMVYVREACGHLAEQWAQLLAEGTPETVRGTQLDAVFVGEVSTKKDTSTIRRGHLDGFYTRVASNGANYAGTWKNWDLLKQTADRYRLLFIPTVAPGYCERHAVRGEPIALRRHRSNGQYYGVAWRTATSVGAQFVSVASYNDWPAGTQIEEAIPYAGHKDYQPTGPRKYLDLTKHWVEEFVRARREAPNNKRCEGFFNNTVC